MERILSKNFDSIKFEDYFNENKNFQQIPLSCLTNDLRLKLTISNQKATLSLDSLSDREILH